MDLILKNVKEKDLAIFKSLAKSLDFEIEKREEKPYDPDFVNEILEAEKSIKEGKGMKIKLEDLWK
jgi:hypothetical protein